MEKKHKIYAAVGVLAVVGIAVFVWHKNKKKAVVAAKPAAPAVKPTPSASPEKTAGAEGEEEETYGFRTMEKNGKKYVSARGGWKLVQ